MAAAAAAETAATTATATVEWSQLCRKDTYMLTRLLQEQAAMGVGLSGGWGTGSPKAASTRDEASRAGCAQADGSRPAQTGWVGLEGAGAGRLLQRQAAVGKGFGRGGETAAAAVAAVGGSRSGSSGRGHGSDSGGRASGVGSKDGGSNGNGSNDSGSDKRGTGSGSMGSSVGRSDMRGGGGGSGRCSRDSRDNRNCYGRVEPAVQEGYLHAHTPTAGAGSNGRRAQRGLGDGLT